MRCFQCGAEHAFHALTASHKYAFCSQECKDTALRQFLSPHYYYENPKDHPHYKSASTVELQDYDSRETIPWHVKNIRRHQADFLKSYAEDRPRAIADAEKKLNEHILAQAERERIAEREEQERKDDEQLRKAKEKGDRYFAELREQANRDNMKWDQQHAADLAEEERWKPKPFKL
jgi:hypothetical protein